MDHTAIHLTLQCVLDKQSWRESKRGFRAVK